MTETMEMMPVAARLWTQARPRAYQCLYHPFVTALGAGTLPRACFEQFLLQDAFYLQGFSKAFAHAVTKAVDMKHVLVLIRLMNGMEQELATHTAFLEVRPLHSLLPSPPCAALTISHCSRFVRYRHVPGAAVERRAGHDSVRRFPAADSQAAGLRGRDHHDHDAMHASVHVLGPAHPRRHGWAPGSPVPALGRCLRCRRVRGALSVLV